MVAVRGCCFFYIVLKSMNTESGEIRPRCKAKIMKTLLKSDSSRWESLAAAGAFFNNREMLEKALKTNPYSPNIHINLYRISDPSEKTSVAEKAKFFCPRHPEVSELK
jgi:hypothetical protein